MLIGSIFREFELFQMDAEVMRSNRCVSYADCLGMFGQSELLKMRRGQRIVLSRREGVC